MEDSDGALIAFSWHDLLLVSTADCALIAFTWHGLLLIWTSADRLDPIASSSSEKGKQTSFVLEL